MKSFGGNVWAVKWTDCKTSPIKLCTTGQTFGVGKTFEWFWKKSLMLTRAGQKYCKNHYIVKYCDLKEMCSIVIYFKNVIYSCDAKLNFQQPLDQSPASHDPSEIILICWSNTRRLWCTSKHCKRCIFQCYPLRWVEMIFCGRWQPVTDAVDTA